MTRAAARRADGDRAGVQLLAAPTSRRPSPATRAAATTTRRCATGCAACAAALRERFPGVQDYGSVDAGPVMEKVWAARAGLGTVGKNGCFITAAVRLAGWCWR